MKIDRRRLVIVLLSLVCTFVVMRGFLHAFPGTNFDVAGYNIHHLFTGLLLLTVGGIPLVVTAGGGRVTDLACVCFGSGLAMALDEWVYLITTDGSDASYLLPISLWGGVIMIGLTAGYILAVAVWFEKRRSKS